MVKIIETVYNFLWGDLLTLPLPGGAFFFKKSSYHIFKKTYW